MPRQHTWPILQNFGNERAANFFNVCSGKALKDFRPYPAVKIVNSGVLVDAGPALVRYRVTEIIYLLGMLAPLRTNYK